MKKLLAILMCGLTMISICACGEISEGNLASNNTNNSIQEDEELEDEKCDQELFEENLDINYDETSDYNGETYYKVEEKCYYDVEIKPMGKVSIKTYEPAQDDFEKDMLIRIYSGDELLHTIVEPDDSPYKGCRPCVENIHIVDFNDDGYDDIIVVEDFVNITYDLSGNEIYADNMLVRLYSGNEQGALIENASFESAVNSDIYDYSLECILEVVASHLDLL